MIADARSRGVVLALATLAGSGPRKVVIRAEASRGRVTTVERNVTVAPF